jgi:hypothetical protein
VQRTAPGCVAAALCLALPAAAQMPIYLKSRTIDTSAGSALAREEKNPARRAARRAANGRGHYLIQFAAPIDDGDIRGLENRGAKVLQYVHQNTLLISLPEGVSLNGAGVSWMGELEPGDKISPALRSSGAQQWALVEFYADTSRGEAQALVSDLGIEWRDNPDVSQRQILALAAPADITALSASDQVSYIFPASDELIAGRRVIACASALTFEGSAGQFIAKMGDGWDGPGKGAATVGYFFSVLTDQLDPASEKQEIIRAFGEWARYAKLTFTPSAASDALQSINILFAKRAHGDPYPFDGRGGALAHTFYPAPPNPESLAGDMHFDDDEPWQIGTDTDLFSVALHEAGHALGLGHSDRPGAVMYPYYTRASKLTDDDIAAILDLYAPQGKTDPPVQPGAPSNPTPAPTNPAPAPPVTPTLPPCTPSTPPSNPPTTPQVPAPKPPDPAPPTTPSAGAATTPPALTITSPGTSIVSTGADSITVRGHASDSLGVTVVKWTTNSGATGTALGTTDWTAGPIPLLTGYNTITIKAYDAAGNIAWRVISVNRQ